MTDIINFALIVLIALSFQKHFEDRKLTKRLKALLDEDEAAAKAREAKLRACLGFFASVIKSGEPWTATCEERYRAALQEKQT